MSSDARCAGWRPIEFDYLNDTLGTIHEIRVHNQVGKNKRCKKFLR